MKKYLSLFAVLAVVCFVNAKTIFAEDTTDSNTIKRPTTEINAIRAEAKTKIDALKASIKSEKNTAKAKIEEARISGRENAMQRFDAAVTRISDLESKVNTKIANLEAKNIAVADAKTFVATADTKLTEAKSKIAEANTLLATSVNQLSSADKTQLRTLSQNIQTLIVDAHGALTNAVKSLKDAVKTKLEKTPGATGNTQ